MFRFLFKLIFYFFIICIIFSFFAPDSDIKKGKGLQVPTQGQTFNALQQTFGDLTHFCERNQRACEIGKNFVSTLGTRVTAGAKMIYNQLDHYFH